MAMGEHADAVAELKTSVDMQRRLTEEFPSDEEIRYQSASAVLRYAAILNEVGQERAALAEVRAAAGTLSVLGATLDFDLATRVRTRRIECRVLEALILSRVSPDHQEMQRAAAQALNMLRALPGEEGNLERSIEFFAIAHKVMGRAYELAGKYDLAESELKQARIHLERLAQWQPERRSWRHELAVVARVLGEVSKAAGRKDDAKSCFDGSLSILEKLHRDFPHSYLYVLNLVRGHRSLGSLLGSMGRRADAEEHMRRALAHAETLPQEKPRFTTYARELAAAWAGLAQAICGNAESVRSGETDQAFDKAIQLQSANLADDPTDPLLQFDLAMTYHNRAAWRFSRRDFAGAGSDAQLAIAQQERALEARPGNKRYTSLMLLHLVVLAESQLFRSQAKEAEATTRRLMKVAQGTHRYDLQVARNLARAASLMPPREPGLEACLDDAVEYVRRAIESGTPAARVSRDSSFAILRKRADWLDLVRDD